jgi:predicted glycoside hydrolase/deacetylase ChbG (UPF0249 family)
MSRIFSVMLSLFMLLLAGSAAADPTYAQRLGWKADDRVLIIHCDDVGMSHANNEGAKEALAYGLVTSVSVMMPCAWVPGWVPYMKEHPETDMGLHLTLTSEYDHYRWTPLAGKNQVPGLTDAQGCLPDNVGLVVENATPDEVELEIRAQIDRAETMGLPITHMDSHMGTLFRPEFIDRYVKVGIEKQIPILIVPAVGALAEKAWAGGLPVLDHVHSDSYNWKTTDIDEKVGLYVDAIRNLKPGITYMIIHCTQPNDMIGIINGHRDFLYGDYFAMIDPRTKRAVEEEGIILTTMRELKARRDRVKDE